MLIESYKHTPIRLRTRQVAPFRVSGIPICGWWVSHQLQRPALPWSMSPMHPSLISPRGKVISIARPCQRGATSSRLPSALVMSISHQKFGIPRKHLNQIGIWYLCPKFIGVSLEFYQYPEYGLLKI